MSATANPRRIAAQGAAALRFVARPCMGDTAGSPAVAFHRPGLTKVLSTLDKVAQKGRSCGRGGAGRLGAGDQR
jgi:hypothetical protein